MKDDKYHYWKLSDIELGGVLVVLAAVSLVSVYVPYVKYKQLEREFKVSSVAISTLTDTSGWKTYRNEKYGFEVGYPGNWKEEKKDENSAVDILILSSPDYSSSTESGSVINQGRAMSIRVFKYRIRKSLQDLEDTIIHDGESVGIKQTNLKIVGSDRIMYDFEYEGTRGKAVHILADSIEIELGVLAGPTEAELDTERIFSKIVSTFKFISTTTATTIDDCALIARSHFQSVSGNLQVGMGPNGPAMGHWEIDLNGNTFSGLMGGGDVTIQGTYTCAKNVLHLKDYGTATYDHDRKILTWNGVEYAQAEQAMVNNASQLLKVESSGGLCTYGGCYSGMTVYENGKYIYQVGTDKEKEGTFTSDQISILKQLISRTDFALLKSKKFTDMCPTAYDGQELVYTFYSPKEILPTCTFNIDASAPLFKFIDALLSSVRK